MKKFFIIFGITSVVGGLAAYYAYQFSKFSDFTFDVAKINLVNYASDSTNFTLNITFKVTNYSSIEATVSKTNINLSINGTYVGNAYQADALTIPALGYNFIDINITLNSSAFLNNLLSAAVAAPSTPINISVDGTTNIKSSIIGFNIPFQNTYATTVNDLISGLF